MSLILDGSGSYRHPDDPGEPTTDRPRLSVTDLEASILAAFVWGLDVLEIGTGLGVSTRALASTARSVTTIDVDPWVHETIWPTLPANVKCVSELEPFLPFDAAFIDGDHSTEAVLRDVATAECHVIVSGFLLAHDTNYDSVIAGLGDGWHFMRTTHGIGIRWVR